jgi:hypothetical protein
MVPGIDMNFLSNLFHWVGREPCFQIYGKARKEKDWRVISVYAHRLYDMNSGWPFMCGVCVTFTSEVIVLGWDMAEAVLAEQKSEPASRRFPVEVLGGRLGDPGRREKAGVVSFPSASEVIAHECGHTWQAMRIGPCYLPLVGSVTLFREGPRPWNRFENEASEQGLFGGIVNRSVCGRLMAGKSE